jgi:hypothetical protein
VGNIVVLQDTLRGVRVSCCLFALELGSHLWLTRARRSSPRNACTNLHSHLHQSSPPCRSPRYIPVVAESYHQRRAACPWSLKQILRLTGLGLTYPGAWRAACNCEALAHRSRAAGSLSIDEFIVAQMHNQQSRMGKVACQTHSYISYAYTASDLEDASAHTNSSYGDHLLSLSISSCTSRVCSAGWTTHVSLSLLLHLVFLTRLLVSYLCSQLHSRLDTLFSSDAPTNSSRILT